MLIFQKKTLHFIHPRRILPPKPQCLPTFKNVFIFIFDTSILLLSPFSENNHRIEYRKHTLASPGVVPKKNEHQIFLLKTLKKTLSKTITKRTGVLPRNLVPPFYFLFFVRAKQIWKIPTPPCFQLITLLTFFKKLFNILPPDRSFTPTHHTLHTTPHVFPFQHPNGLDRNLKTMDWTKWR